MQKEQPDNIKLLLDEAIESDIPQIYFNGFSCSLSAGDVLIGLMKNGKTTAVLNTSYSAAKTLVHYLGNIIKNLEDKTGNEIMTIDFLQQKLYEEGSK